MTLKWLGDAEHMIFMDEETHEVIGQIMRDGPAWIAYDNDPAHHDGQSAKRLGRFGYLHLAKKAVEQLVN